MHTCTYTYPIYMYVELMHAYMYVHIPYIHVHIELMHAYMYVHIPYIHVRRAHACIHVCTHTDPIERDLVVDQLHLLGQVALLSVEVLSGLRDQLGVVLQLVVAELEVLGQRVDHEGQEGWKVWWVVWGGWVCVGVYMYT